MNNEKVSKKFWQKQSFYPNYPFVKERRKYELDFLLKHIDINSDSLLDIGCGNGSTVIMLRETTYIKHYYCYDISKKMLSLNWGDRDSEIYKKVWDFNDPISIPKTDVAISMNMFSCIFDDAKIHDILSNIKSDLFIARITCNDTRLVINKHSDDLSSDIAMIYRTPREYIDIFMKHYQTVHLDRCFPDEIESKYATKQYFFICKR